ncbi:MAG: hypothetical protein RIS09_335 [Actinomycetota bacterium]|jgi:hypothetical protein
MDKVEGESSFVNDLDGELIYGHLRGPLNT